MLAYIWAANMSKPALLSVRNLSVRFPLKGRDEHGKRKTLLAVDNVSFDIPEGKTLGIVGESGFGQNNSRAGSRTAG